jgi:putative membrane protein
MLDFWLATAHHATLLILVSALGAHSVLLRLSPSAEVVQRLARLDLLYGISAVLLLVAGGLRLSFGAKGVAFYTGNPVFWGKMAVFVLIGALSIVPTLRFIRWKRDLPQGLPEATQWTSTRKIVFTEVHLLFFVAMAAAAMARGIGH